VCPTSPLDVVANDLENGPCAPLRTRLYLAKEDGDDAQADFFPAQAAPLGRVRECTKVISRSLKNFEATVDVVRQRERAGIRRNTPDEVASLRLKLCVYIKKSACCH
jgi:hypothetical protein